MRAVRCHELVGPNGLRVDEVPDPTPGPGEVLIDVSAAGVNFPDILLTEGKYQFKPPPPFIPGGEVGGIVRAIGPGVTAFSPGDRVAAFMIFGAFAERVVAAEGAAVKVPDGVDLRVAASMVITYGTMMHGLVDRGMLRSGETLLVLGAAGGVGTAAIEIGKSLGARVIAAASNQAKLAFCKELGADATIDTSKENLKDRAKALAPAGVDVICDPVGGDLSEAALRTLGWGGRHLVIGFASGTIPKIPTNLTLLKACQIVGVFYGMFCGREPAQNKKHLERAFGWMLEGKIRPHVDRTFSFEEAGEALGVVARREVRGKLVLVP
jgi:NADPH2:quinone reductase